MRGKLGAIAFYAPDHVALAEWYHQKLGLPSAKRYEDAHVGFVHDGIYFGFNQKSPAPTPGAISLYFEVEDCDAEFEAIRSRGAEVVSEPHDAHWGARVACFSDPLGNKVWLYKYNSTKD